MDRPRLAYAERLQTLRDYSAAQRLPRRLRQRMEAHLALKYADRQASDTNDFTSQTLPFCINLDDSTYIRAHWGVHCFAPIGRLNGKRRTTCATQYALHQY